MQKLLPLLSVILTACGTLSARNDTIAGRFIVENPTLINLGFEWEIEGDDNRNAEVAVQFRAVGDPKWRPAMPLSRIGGERVWREREHLDYIVPHLFAGSILNLEPGTEYECRFQMADPDGVTGESVKTVIVKTRTEPQRYEGGRVLHVYPPDWEGEREEPSFTGILQAYYGAGLGDWSVVRERPINAGDTILMHAGLYRVEPWNYVDPMMTPFDGSMSLTLKGTLEKPITITAAGDGEVVIDGDGCHRLFDVMASEYHIFENLTFRNTDVAIFAGQKDVAGAVGLTVKNCRFENIGFGVWTEYAGSSDFYIADNLFIGRDDRFRLVGFGSPQRTPDGPSWEMPLYGSHRVVSYYAVKVYGPGHVIAHNSIAYFHDAIGVSTYGSPPKDPYGRASAIDIYNNDVHMSNDDYIEADGGVYNIRIMNNRGVNAAMGGLSAQPVFGGPAYYIGNILYHGPKGAPFKFGRPAGVFVYHNTVFYENRVGAANMHFRNNLFLGHDDPKRPIMSISNSHSVNSSDYNGYRPNKGVENNYNWYAPRQGEPPNYSPSREDWENHNNLADFRAATGQEIHSIEVDFDIFEDLEQAPRSNPWKVYHAMDLNFKLKANSKAVDAGVVIPTVNDNFVGRAPDLGALEVGAPEIHYGARWITWEPFYR